MGVDLMSFGFSDKSIGYGFLAAGFYNIFGMLFFSQAFTNYLMGQVDPVVFSTMGQLAIVLWGFAYCAVSKSFRHVPYLVLVFAVEKLIYFSIWVHWISLYAQNLHLIAQESLLTAAFYAIYGVGDALSCVFFVFVFLKSKGGGKLVINRQR